MRTEECVSPKHPHKLCDRVSDALLDRYLENDPNARCIIEVCNANICDSVSDISFLISTSLAV